jgi:hypothetical protein
MAVNIKFEKDQNEFCPFCFQRYKKNDFDPHICGQLKNQIKPDYVGISTKDKPDKEK